jgi:hypothetical protein
MQVIKKYLNAVLTRLAAVSASVWLVAGGVFTSAVGYAGVANATGVISLKELSETVTTEITANLPYILTVFGIILVIAVMLHLARRFFR